MRRKVYTVEPHATVAEALEIMAKRAIGSVVVVKDGRPVGMVTERDIIGNLAKRRNILDMNVRKIMSKPLISVTPETSVVRALQTMKKKNIRRLTVVSGGRLVGIVTIHKDLLYWALSSKANR
jgi:CBS domain-containing protein